MADPNNPVKAAAAITPGTPVNPGRGVLIACTAAGIVRLVMEQSGTLDVSCPAAGSFEMLGYRVVGVSVAGTTATAVVSVLY